MSMHKYLIFLLVLEIFIMEIFYVWLILSIFILLYLKILVNSVRMFFLAKLRKFLLCHEVFILFFCHLYGCVHATAHRGYKCWTPLNWTYRQLWATQCVYWRVNLNVLFTKSDFFCMSIFVFFSLLKRLWALNNLASFLMCEELVTI